MFVYYTRIRERFGQECVVSLGVLADEDPAFRPDTYACGCFGCTLRFTFPTVKLLDWRQQWQELEASDNPFAVVVMAHLKAREQPTDMLFRKKWKIKLIRGMYERGYTRQQIIDLFTFIDWLLVLPEEMEQEVWGDNMRH